MCYLLSSTAPFDYTALTNLSVVFPANTQPSTVQILFVSINNDNIPEDIESFSLLISDNSSRAFSTLHNATGLILDDDGTKGSGCS